MFRKILFLSIFSLLFLAACSDNDGANEEADENVTNENEIVNEVEEEMTNGEEENVDTEEELEQDEENEKNGEELEQEGDRTITYTINGETKTETAEQVQSENNNYSILILPQFELIEEEPNRDAILYSEDDEVLMRIEALNKDADWNTIIENTKLEVGMGEWEVTSIDPPSEPFFQDAIGFSASNDGIIKKAYLIKDEQFPLKLTLFLKDNADLTDPFLKMAATIKKD